MTMNAVQISLLHLELGLTALAAMNCPMGSHPTKDPLVYLPKGDLPG